MLRPATLTCATVIQSSCLLIFIPDEPRRSGRATKGQHTKNEEEPGDGNKKRGKGARGKAAKKAEEGTQEEEEEAVIRCICGYVVEDKNDKRAMICCDKCEAWQHNVCMGLSDDDDELPDTYFCEQCKPQDHKETLQAIKKGIKIWETRQADAQREEEEKKSRKRKGGRKSKGGRPSEVAPVERKESPTIAAPPQPAEPSPPPAEVQPPAPPTPISKKTETGTKRKTPSEHPLDATKPQETVRFACILQFYKYLFTTGSFNKGEEGLNTQRAQAACAPTIKHGGCSIKTRFKGCSAAGRVSGNR